KESPDAEQARLLREEFPDGLPKVFGVEPVWPLPKNLKKEQQAARANYNCFFGLELGPLSFNSADLKYMSGRGSIDKKGWVRRNEFVLIPVAGKPAKILAYTPNATFNFPIPAGHTEKVLVELPLGKGKKEFVITLDDEGEISDVVEAEFYQGNEVLKDIKRPKRLVNADFAPLQEMMVTRAESPAEHATAYSYYRDWMLAVHQRLQDPKVGERTPAESEFQFHRRISEILNEEGQTIALKLRAAAPVIGEKALIERHEEPQFDEANTVTQVNGRYVTRGPIRSAADAENSARAADSFSFIVARAKPTIESCKSLKNTRLADAMTLITRPYERAPSAQPAAIRAPANK
ncbi:MAG: hypothetical protein ABL958_19550, partial [Bdellovibrionia bacterium]